MAIALPKYDLHTHSTASDGALAPEILLERAVANHVEILSLTDHDTLKGVDRLMQTPNPGNIRLLPGVELTADWSGRMVHIVGLNVQPNQAAIRLYLEQLEALRILRAQRICDRLIKSGVPDDNLLEQVVQESGGGSIGRPHFAKVLVRLGMVGSEQAAFKQFLGAGKVGDVKMDWPSLKEAVAVINAAGGEAVLAHPTKYRMTFTKIRSLVSDFADIGGSTLEVSYTGITPNHQVDLERLAAQKNLMISAGSDFHSPAHAWTEVGKFPAVKDPSRHVLLKFL